jgi:tetratricopeptide (TPR) repeat protein
MIQLTLLFAALAAFAHPASAMNPSALVAAKRDLQAAVDSASAPAMVRARARFQALSAAEPGVAALHLWIATATWRVVPLLMRGDAPQAERLLRDGLAHCEEAIRMAPGDGEPLAVKAGLQGFLMRFDPSSMMTIGPESQANLVRALELSPANPRVWLFNGIQTLHKPAAFGGSAAGARGQFQKAIERFTAAVPGDSTAMDWGADDACQWAGQAAMQLRDFPGAVEMYEKALTLNPASRWVRGVLLPAARDSLARGPLPPAARDSLAHGPLPPAARDSLAHGGSR